MAEQLGVRLHNEPVYRIRLGIDAGAASQQNRQIRPRTSRVDP